MRLQQILINLNNNAIKFTEEGRVDLVVAVAEQTPLGSKLRFCVADTGIGMPPEVLDRIFDPFEQADGSTTRKYGGTGLGLTICQRLVRLMGGEITATSSPGVGSRFGFELEFRKSMVSENSPPAASDSESRLREDDFRTRILVVEDDWMNREVIRELLGEIVGFEVDLAHDGEQAVDFAARNPYALILMDAQMPVLDGLAATRRIRSVAGRWFPIIALTANAFADDRSRAWLPEWTISSPSRWTRTYSSPQSCGGSKPRNPPAAYARRKQKRGAPFGAPWVLDQLPSSLGLGRSAHLLFVLGLVAGARNRGQAGKGKEDGHQAGEGLLHHKRTPCEQDRGSITLVGRSSLHKFVAYQMFVTYQTIRIVAAAPEKPARGAPCNGCGVCCAAEPCPVARIVFRLRVGSCPALRWVEGDHRYRCDLVVAPQHYLAWIPPALTRRLFARWIAAEQGCDSDCQDAGPA